MKKTVSLLLALLMTACCLTAGAETTKHERVCVVADTAGNIRTLIDSVRLENADGLDEIRDRTGLTDIENVGGHETFSLNGEELLWQADGHSIRYQGIGTEAPAAVPAVKWTLDGQEIPAEKVCEAAGRLEMTVSYRHTGKAPCLAVSLIPVPAGAKNITLENAFLLDEGITPLIVGFAVPGADEALSLPASFTVTCDADRADFSWMMTAATGEPLKRAAGLLNEAVGASDPDAVLADAVSVLTALSGGGQIPELTGEAGQYAAKLNELLNGTAAISSGASGLNDGILSVQSGVGDLSAGLDTLQGSSDALNSGAGQILQAVLETANGQLAAAGLEAFGIGFQPLTAENYGTVLENTILAIQTAVGHAEEAARAQVAAAVDAQEDAIRAAVTEAVRDKVITAVLSAAGLNMDAAQYASAVQAGLVPEEKAAMLTAAVDAQMASDDVQLQIRTATEQQKAALTEQNMASETVQAQISSAVAAGTEAIGKLSGLKAQLDSVTAFRTGLAAYTDGVSQIRTGAETLKAGVDALAAGSVQLTAGAADLDSGLRAGLQTAAAKYLPYVQHDLSDALQTWNSVSADLAGAAGYDLCAEGMKTDTVFIIRTVLDR